MDKNPFSIYDSLGYVFPGSLTILLGQFVHYLKNEHLYLEWKNVFSFIESITKNFSWEDSLIYLLIAYLIGHIIAYCSSLTIEPYAVWRYGYPSKFMIRDNIEKDYFSVNDKEEDCIKIICIKSWKFIVGLLVFPLLFCDRFLGKKLGLQIYYVKKLDDVMIFNIENKVKLLYKKLGLKEINDLRHNDEDFFTVAYHYEYEKKNAHNRKMDNYVALYGFTRALTFISILCFHISLIMVICNWSLISHLYSIIWLVTLMLLTYIFFMSFMKFYRRYSLETLMCLLTDEDLKS